MDYVKEKSRHPIVAFLLPVSYAIYNTPSLDLYLDKRKVEIAAHGSDVRTATSRKEPK
jgi:hypothetical protein